MNYATCCQLFWPLIVVIGRGFSGLEKYHFKGSSTGKSWKHCFRFYKINPLTKVSHFSILSKMMSESCAQEQWYRSNHTNLCDRHVFICDCSKLNWLCCENLKSHQVCCFYHRSKLVISFDSQHYGLLFIICFSFYDFSEVCLYYSI
jgi:hypothetical protein